MPYVAALFILLISLWLCDIIDALPHILPGVSMTPFWLWLGLGAIVLSWFMRDSR
ncbi:MAG: hypothetical protein ACFB2W_06140 [Leptolyngbyaceae cyanobacterium]